jgi:hypothetical protein
MRRARTVDRCDSFDGRSEANRGFALIRFLLLNAGKALLSANQFYVIMGIEASSNIS